MCRQVDPFVAAEAVAQNKIDGAGFARQFLADQAWVTKLIDDRLKIFVLVFCVITDVLICVITREFQMIRSFRIACIFRVVR